MRTIVSGAPDDASFTVEKMRFLKILDRIQHTLSIIDPEIVPFNRLDLLQKGIQQHVIPHLQNFSNNIDAQSLVQANDSITNQLIELSILEHFSENSDVNKFEDSSIQVYESFVNKIHSEIGEIESERARIDKIIDDQKTKLEDQSKRIESIFDIVKNIEEDGRSRISSLEIDVEKKLNTLYENAKQQNTIMLSEIESSSESKLDRIIQDSTHKHSEILGLYELVATDSVASGYIRTAGEQERQANFWRWLALVFMVAIVFWLLYVFFSAPAFDYGNGEWIRYLPSIGITAVLAFGAAYSSQQSTKHRNMENRVRWFALQVKAIDPFIFGLKEEDQASLKSDLSKKLFGVTHEDEKIDVIEHHGLSTIVKSIVSILKANK